MIEIGRPVRIPEPRGCIERDVRDRAGRVDGGVGDLGAAFKHAVVHSARTGTIVSFGLDVSVPTGRADRGPRRRRDGRRSVRRVRPAAAGRRVRAGARGRRSSRRFRHGQPGGLLAGGAGVEPGPDAGSAACIRRCSRCWAPASSPERRRRDLGSRAPDPGDAEPPQAHPARRRRARSGEHGPRAARCSSGRICSGTGTRGAPSKVGRGCVVATLPSPPCWGPSSPRRRSLPRPRPPARRRRPCSRRRTSCLACHNGMTTPSGKTSRSGSPGGGRSWPTRPATRTGKRRSAARPSDHPAAAPVIQDECAACHMPMARFEAHVAGREVEVFSRLGGGPRGGAGDPLALDGVSCALCHQLQNGASGARARRRIQDRHRAPVGRASGVRPVRHPAAARARHALGDGIPPGARDQSEAVRALLHLPHAVYDAARRRRRPAPSTNRRRASPSRCRTWNGGPAPTSARRAARPAT